ncbi:MAG: hypothetical protein JW703_01975 [Candidatus Diapherotrites archaeon]|nr:hypothetical protein [Candidatus Diapherotrites archaeon]
MILLASMIESIQIALLLVILVWIYSWAKENLGSDKLAILFAVIVVFLTFYSFPELIWMGVILFVFATFGKELFSRLNPFHGGGLN